MTHIEHFAPTLARLIDKYPTLAAPLLQTFTDLSLAQSWSNLEAIDLDECEKVILRGNEGKLVLPMNLDEPISMGVFKDVFKAIGKMFPREGGEEEVGEMFLAMVDRDSSVLYYVLKDGIVSPKEVPE